MKKLFTSLLFFLPAFSGAQVTFLAQALQPAIVFSGTASTTMTLPAASDTLVGLAATQTLTNKTLTSPTLTGPTLGVATATSINGNIFTTGTYTLTGTAAKTLNFTNTLTLSGTDSTTMTFPATSGTVATLNNAQTITAAKTFTNSDLLLLGSSTGATTFTSANASASNFTLTLPAVTDTVAVLGTFAAPPSAGLGSTTAQPVYSTTLLFGASFKNNNTSELLTTAGTGTTSIASGFGSTPSISQNNGTASFSINVGTGGSATSGVVTLTAASHAWSCFASDTGTTPTGRTEVTAGTTTSITLTNYSRTTGLAVAWTASEIIQVGCWAN